ncbi:MAG: hypothetical protein M3P52_03550, partial [Actinomycetota bacterium]|nr:hypothetical protein [Actinomycetota bacterium]
MRRRTLGVVLLLITVSLGTGPVHRVAAQPSRTGGVSNTDPELRAEVEGALAHRVAGRRDPLIVVEVLTADNRSVEQAVNQLGGTVTGSVDGQLVQALMPAGVVDELSAADAARYVQQPLRVNRLPRVEVGGFGPVVGEAVPLTGATAWHEAGITGNVRVGIIDFFDLRLWDPLEHGSEPDAAHQYCPDVTLGLCTAG